MRLCVSFRTKLFHEMILELQKIQTFKTVPPLTDNLRRQALSIEKSIRLLWMTMDRIDAEKDKVLIQEELMESKTDDELIDGKMPPKIDDTKEIK